MGFSCLMAVIALPILIPFYSRSFVSADYDIGIVPILSSAALVVIPVGVGVAARSYSDILAARLEKVAGALGGFSILASIAIQVATNFDAFFSVSALKLYVPCLFMMPIGGALGFNIGKCLRLGLPRKSLQTLAFESGLQNGVVALSILELAFGVGSDIFLQGSIFIFMCMTVANIHGSIWICYFRSTTGSADPDTEAAEL